MMKTVNINLLTAPTVRMPLVPRKAHKLLIITFFILYLIIMIIMAGGVIPLASHTSRGLLAFLKAPFVY